MYHSGEWLACKSELGSTELSAGPRARILTHRLRTLLSSWIKSAPASAGLRICRHLKMYTVVYITAPLQASSSAPPPAHPILLPTPGGLQTRVCVAEKEPIAAHLGVIAM